MVPRGSVSSAENRAISATAASMLGTSRARGRRATRPELAGCGDELVSEVPIAASSPRKGLLALEQAAKLPAAVHNTLHRNRGVVVPVGNDVGEDAPEAEARVL